MSVGVAPNCSVAYDGQNAEQFSAGITTLMPAQQGKLAALSGSEVAHVSDMVLELPDDGLNYHSFTFILRLQKN
ncbi:1045_t:CDS:2 [Ambispora leptoticha]|uniref:1045_t:CDS:1 n=1 Tax=Ambispora leptoticha TaxID=144679 RepID=A0A9N9IEX0_9GLOM|nr:1045_t:CDS:2 [Ambispora leptoticha]